MKSKLTLLACGLLLAAASQAAVTDIAQVPVLNIKGTGAVKPNLMLIYDNSGSMDFDYTPDIVARKSGGASNICRGASTLSTAVMNCANGHPPFNSPDFNKQYYNPALRYTPAVAADGTPYSLSGYGIASPWDKVRVDPFLSTSTKNIKSYGDLEWCTTSALTDCLPNTAGYRYPNNERRYPKTVSVAPYYYSILVSEYCSDANLTNCVPVKVGAAAPSGYPFPAKVRWCATKALLTTECQAKTDNAHIYPRFFASSAGQVSYGVVSIGNTVTTQPASLTSVSVNQGGTSVEITNGPVVAAGGANTNSNRAALVNELAASINAKTGLTTQYLACVKTPTLPTVSACSTYSISLATIYEVAVIPLQCDIGVTDKASCVPTPDMSVVGWSLSAATVPVLPTAFISFSGKTGNSFSLTSMRLGGKDLFANTLSISNASNADVTAAAFMNKINALSGSTVKAYLSGNSVTKACADAGASATSLCLVDTAATGNGATIAFGTFKNSGSMAHTEKAGDGYDILPVATSPISGGGDVFVRTNIVSGSTYPKHPDRLDCAAANFCTYDEEMNNFATWYAFYRVRDQMMKTAIGQAFAGVSSSYRVGLSVLSQVSSSYANIAVRPNTFEGTHRTTWYDTLYKTTTSGSTPMRQALHNTALAFKNSTDFITELCQPNFILLTTDGYWNGGAAADVQNNDNVENPARFCTAAAGCVDADNAAPPASNTLADIALYWYNGGSNSGTVSLSGATTGRLAESMSTEGKVPGRDGENKHLHINTYTLGLGMDGIMTYNPTYDKVDSGDFSKIKNGAMGCPWNGGGKYIWPDPKPTDGNDQQSRVDDLWHAAVNGKGKYFSASDPEDVVKGVREALNNMQASVGAAAAAATSTPNISQQDNDIFSDTFTTVKWYGELTAQSINPLDGTVSDTKKWTTSATLGKKVGAATDTRTIYMRDADNGGLKPFTYDSMNASEKLWFANRCSDMAQCTLLNTTERAVVNSGPNLVNWLRGQQQYANDTLFRAYASYDPNDGTAPIPIVLGDIVSSKPAYLRDPRKSYTLAGYAAYKAEQSAPATTARKAMVYTAANDGMLHAFDAATGFEEWAYVPRIIMKKLAKQASTEYATSHQYTTDGSPDLGDVQIGGVWRTVLVAGLGAGGRGYYALDVTVPHDPKLLWELCADATICSKNDPNIGLTMGNAQFGMYDGKWVVFLTSGYNNVSATDGVSSGDGKGHLYIVDVATGTILKDISTGSGDTGSPSGLAKITAISNNPNTDPVITYVYGGDTFGQMWRFNPAATGAVPATVLMGNAGTSQPITTRPDVSTCMVTNTATDGTKTKQARRVVLFGTGRLLALSDMKNIELQSLYLLKDLDLPVGNPIPDVRGGTMVEQELSNDTVDASKYKITSKTVDLAVNDGWWVDLDRNVGERVNLDPRIVSNTVTAVTNIPGESDACSVGGSSKVYTLSLCSGRAPTGYDIVGRTLSGNSAAVGYIIITLPSGQRKIITTLADGRKLTDQGPPSDSVGTRKTGWRRVQN